MDQEKIGKFIASLRKEKNMTQQDFADKLGVSNKTVGNWENGRNMPDLSLFKPICNELNISADELILGERIGNDKEKKKIAKNLLKEIFVETVDENTNKEKSNILLLIMLIIILLIMILLVVTHSTGEISWLHFLLN